MLPFFRKIRYRLAANNQFIKYSRYAIGEIALVVVGILIALQVNNWNEDKNIRKIENKLLQELKTDLEETKLDLLTDMDKAQFELLVIDSLYQKIQNDRANNNPQPIRISMQFIYNRSKLVPKNSAYESLQAFGINLITKDHLRKSITDLYELQLVRVDDLEKYIKEVLEQGFLPHLIEVSKPTDDCIDCKSLKELFSQRSARNTKYYHVNAPSLGSNYYEVDSPDDQFLHLLKIKYMAYSALTSLYTSTSQSIDDLIDNIDLETSSN